VDNLVDSRSLDIAGEAVPAALRLESFKNSYLIQQIEYRLPKVR
jgi:hypothetical protein